MKKLKIVSFILATVLLMSMVVSCSSNKLTVTVIFAVTTDDGEEVLLETDVNIGTTDTPPTALQAAEKALTENSIPYSLSEDKTAITSVSDYAEYEEQTSESSRTGYAWFLTIDERDSFATGAFKTTIYDGDVIKFTWRPYNSIT